MKPKFLKTKASFMIFVLLVAFVAFSNLMSSVSAEDNRVCCEKTKDDSDYNGAHCIFTTQDNCDTSSPWKVESPICELTSMCVPGCCVGEWECEESVLKGVCLADEGNIWKLSLDCSADIVPQCQKGCCMLSGTNAVFTTQAKCQDLVEPYSNLELQNVFDATIQSESECLLAARGQEEGCCMVPGECSFTTRSNCPEGVDFEPDTLCSYEPLGCECTPKHETGCRDGYEEVYWFDSCGNPENIYGATYRPDGIVVSKEQSCINPTSVETNNAGSLTCGNCNYAFSSICAEADDNFLRAVRNSNLPETLKPKLNAMCTDLKCYNTQESSHVLWMDGRTRENGESWCEYEGAVGDGLDLVGSRHILHQCINGEEIVLPCKEERKEICVQGEIPEGFDEISGQTSAMCKPNNWQTCLDANSKLTCDLSEYTIDKNHLSLCGAECNTYVENQGEYDASPGTLRKDEGGGDLEKEWIDCCKKQLCRKQACEGGLIKEGCYWSSYFGTCLPQTPIGGFDPNKDIFGISVSELCDIADFSCSELWEKRRSGSPWRCVENCNCWTRVYGTEANNFCRSLGDCGAHYNVVGQESLEGFKIIDGSPVKRKSGFWGETETFGHGSQGFSFEDFSSFRTAREPLSGSILWLHMNIERAATFISPDESYAEYYNEALRTWLYITAGIPFTYFFVTNLVAVIGSSSAAAAAAGSAALWGSMAAEATAAGLPVATELAATAEGYSVTAAAGSSVWTTVFIWAAVAIALFFLIQWILSWGHETAHVNYYFNCNPWVQPLNGDDCERCDDFEVCDEYKCRSLGANCNFTNKEYRGMETCIGLENDLTPPIIKPYMIAPLTEDDIIKTPAGQGLNGGYEFKQTFDSFSDVEIGISTIGDDNNPEPSICKISRKPALSYDEMIYYFNGWEDRGAPIIQEDHVILIPYLAEGVELDPGEDKIVLEGGKTNTFYAKCINTNGVANIKDYFIKIKVNDEPDGRAPIIEEYSLINGAVLPAGTNQTALTLYTNERTASDYNLTYVGGCRWSTTRDVSYYDMENDFICSEERVDRQHYSCTGLLTGLQENSVFYFKCRDVAGNANDADQPADGFYLYLSEGLDIVDYSPLNEEIFANGITLAVQTSGGASGDGSSTCYYSQTSFYNVNSVSFENTGGSTHTNEFATLASGQHSYYAWCEDSAGNAATQLIEFTLSRDYDAPELERIYVDGTRLYIQLNENAECEYSIDGPLVFGIEGNNQMESSDGLTHFCQLDENEVYNIVCQDDWDNQVSFVVYP